MNDAVIIAFQFVVLVFSVIVHEVSHGAVAEKLGDPTARLAGRLTLNPLKHLDPLGSVLLPILLAASGLPVFGWAKPVPYNPNNLRDPKVGGAKIAAAGPVSNLVVALLFGTVMRIMASSGIGSASPLFLFFSIIVLINVVLAIFNLVPIPPLDGSKVLFALLPPSEGSYAAMRFLERYGLIFVLAFVFFGFEIIIPIIGGLFYLFTGQKFG